MEIKCPPVQIKCSTTLVVTIPQSLFAAPHSLHCNPCIETNQICLYTRTVHVLPNDLTIQRTHVRHTFWNDAHGQIYSINNVSPEIDAIVSHGTSLGAFCVHKKYHVHLSRHNEFVPEVLKKKTFETRAINPSKGHSSKHFLAPSWSKIMCWLFIPTHRQVFRIDNTFCMRMHESMFAGCSLSANAHGLHSW